ncbi:aspartate aminotransferase-like enzyme [Desulfohalotomaculum tongense]|uniref:pyridoxal-phosphate-dependent aminotransferase family protein n=1 Tax=Desulforadius tongensis TaxID=1216062 RepID=UPI00195E854C|nr:alanine--glyoxylate aminotransferase family protein [Desulforadius tongensis]MBM7855153.1 aspartate aminotransferase-like enzyme [Desulforadius tongensis]
MKDKLYLMIPGPTPVPPAVVNAMSRPIIGHRSAEFAALIGRVTDKLKKVFQTENEVFVLACSGTGGLEAAVANVVSPGDKVITLNTGKFGERFGELARKYGADVDEIKFGWGCDVDIRVVEEKLKADPDIKAVFATHNETSTGVVNDIEGLGRLTAQHQAVLVVDAVSSMGGMDIRTDEWKVDIMVSGSQKAMMLPPGLAFVSVSPKAWNVIEQNKAPKYYFDLIKARKSLGKNNTPYTSAVSLYYGLEAALDMMLEEGLENVFKRHKLLAKATRAAVMALGLELLPALEYASDTVTAVQCPMTVDVNNLRKTLLDKYRVMVAGGQGELKGKIFRIAHMGYTAKADVLLTIAALEMALNECGYKAELGAGVREAQLVFLGEDN